MKFVLCRKEKWADASMASAFFFEKTERAFFFSIVLKKLCKFAAQKVYHKRGSLR